MGRPEIRSARSGDLAEVIRLLKITNAKWQYGDSTATLAAKLKHDRDSILVVLVNGKVAGVILTVFDPLSAFFSHLVVDPLHRGQRLGTLLVEEAERRMLSRGAASLAAFVPINEPLAHAFFKKKRYEVQGSSGDFWRREKKF